MLWFGTIYCKVCYYLHKMKILMVYFEREAVKIMKSRGVLPHALGRFTQHLG